MELLTVLVASSAIQWLGSHVGCLKGTTSVRVTKVLFEQHVRLQNDGGTQYSTPLLD